MNQQPLDPKAVDFQPDAVEIAMRPLPRAARMGVIFGVVVFSPLSLPVSSAKLTLSLKVQANWFRSIRIS